jgi:hypothetical protein
MHRLQCTLCSEEAVVEPARDRPHHPSQPATPSGRPSYAPRPDDEAARRSQWRDENFQPRPFHIADPDPSAGEASKDFDPDYLAWRDRQLKAYDEDYLSWREAQIRRHDDDYRAWRRSASNEPSGSGAASPLKAEGEQDGQEPR